MSKVKKIGKIFLGILVLVALFFVALSFRDIPEKVSYGISFSKYRAEELGLSYKEVLRALLDDLKVRRFRLVAHWPMVEPNNDQYNFSDLDYQVEEVEKKDGKIVLAVGRRLPSWPECHEPGWAKDLAWDERKKEILSYIEKTVLRYKDNKSIEYWQVENEPFLTVFAYDHCGDLDRDFLKEEIAFVRSLDPTREILVTDSGNLGLWKDAWRSGDLFGTSVYMYLWNPAIGQVRSIYLPSFYRVKTGLMELFFENKKSFLIELSLEPWLLEPIVKAPIETQLERMSVEKFDEIISFAKKTGFGTQYLWGGEWWYFMKEKDYPEFWERARTVFRD